MFRKLSKKRRPSDAKSLEPGTEHIDGPVLDQDSHGAGNQQSLKRKDKQITVMMIPDKEVEESVLELNRNYVSKNLPSDDVAPLMLARGLLTEMEHSKYRSLREGSRPDYEKSEHLLGCLLKRGAGLLISFCEILNSIEPAKHIAKELEQAFHEQTTKEGFDRRRSSKRSHSDHDIMKKKVSRSSRQPIYCSRCVELEQECEKQRQINDDLKNKLRQLMAQVDYQITISRKPIKDKKKESAAELREHLTDAKTKIGELQSAMCVIEERFTTYNTAYTGHEQNVELLEQVQHTLGQMISQNVVTERRTLGPRVEASSQPPVGFQQFVPSTDTSDTEPATPPQEDLDRITQSNRTVTPYQPMRSGPFHYKQKSESDLLDEKPTIIERTSSHPTMRALATETRPRQSSVPPQVQYRTSSVSTTDLGRSSDHYITRDQQKLHNGMTLLNHRSHNTESESTTPNQHYSSESDIHYNGRETPSNHFTSSVQETLEKTPPPTKPKPPTKRKPSMSNAERTHNLSVDSSPTNSQASQQSDVSAELKSKLNTRLKMSADS